MKTVKTETQEVVTEKNRILDWSVSHHPGQSNYLLTVTVGEIVYIAGAFVSAKQTRVHTFTLEEVAAGVEKGVAGLPTDFAVFYGGIKELLYRLVDSRSDEESKIIGS